MAEHNYTEANIRSLDWKEHIRLRPGMYIGKLGDGSAQDDGIYVLLKEVIDNFRDRRTLASALIMGPLFGPLLFAFVINLSIERSLDDIDRSMELPVIGEQHAPNLMRYLASHN